MRTVLDHDQDERSLTPRRAIRHRPVDPEVLEPGQVAAPAVPRASRKQQRHEPHTTSGPPSGAGVAVSPPRRRSRWARSAWVSVVIGMAIALLLIWAAQNVLHWGQTVADDLHYGRPRTTHVDHRVGHEVAGSTALTHFVAFNLDGQVYVLELPGGNPAGARLLRGPHLVGTNAALVSVTLEFVGGGQHPDLLIVAGTIEVRFHNTGTTFVPAP